VLGGTHRNKQSEVGRKGGLPFQTGRIAGTRACKKEKKSPGQVEAPHPIPKERRTRSGLGVGGVDGKREKKTFAGGGKTYHSEEKKKVQSREGTMPYLKRKSLGKKKRPSGLQKANNAPVEKRGGMQRRENDAASRASHLWYAMIQAERYSVWWEKPFGMRSQSSDGDNHRGKDTETPWGGKKNNLHWAVSWKSPGGDFSVERGAFLEEKGE